MAKTKDKDNKGGGTIALNKRARFEYHIDQRFEAGVALQGWELKALRAGRINFGDSYAIVSEQRGIPRRRIHPAADQRIDSCDRGRSTHPQTAAASQGN